MYARAFSQRHPDRSAVRTVWVGLCLIALSGCATTRPIIELPELTNWELRQQVLGAASDWFPFGTEAEVVVPSLHRITGRVVHADGSPAVGATVKFQRRYDLRSKTEKGLPPHRFDSAPAVCSDDGTYEKRVLSDTYWLDVHWTPRGNAVMARAVAERLVSQGVPERGRISLSPPGSARR